MTSGRSPRSSIAPDGKCERCRGRRGGNDIRIGNRNSEADQSTPLPNSQLLIRYSCGSGLLSDGTIGARALSRARSSRLRRRARPGRDRLRVVERQPGGEAPAPGRRRALRAPAARRPCSTQRVACSRVSSAVRALVVVGDEALHFLIDLERRVLAVVLVLRDLAAEEDLLFLLAEGQRPHRVAHAPLADHACAPARSRARGRCRRRS